MNRALIVKSVRDARLLLLALCLLLFAFAGLQIWVSSMISLPAFSDFLLNALPQKWERFSDVPFTQVATPAGRIAVTFVHPLVFLTALAWAISRGSDCVSGEIGRGTMEILLAQPVSRSAIYGTQALTTVIGAALLATSIWCGTALGLAIFPQENQPPATVFLAPAFSNFGLIVCLSGMSALFSSWENQRWRTIGWMGAWYAGSFIVNIIGRLSDRLHWVYYGSFLSAYKPQLLVAHSDEAWSVLPFRDGTFAGLGYGSQPFLLLGMGITCYVTGAIVFNRRELPAPL
jgi:ABC-2 type transport system permease protein